MSFLQKKIMEASQKYYSGEDSGVSDEQFDAMLDELKEEDPNSPLLTSVGHGYQVSEDSTPGKKYKHYYGLAGSLDKCHNWKELGKLEISSKVVWASLKLDGLSVVMYFESGKLVRALTRGDGEIGIDITDKVIKILGCNHIQSNFAFTGAIRGEIVMSYSNFDKFKELHPEAKNPRNSTAGLINGKEITNDFEFLDIIVYTVVGADELFIAFIPLNYDCMYHWLSTLGFKHVPAECLIVCESNLDNCMSCLQSTWYGEYPADGIVLTYPQLLSTRVEKGQYGISYDAKAYKFKAESATTTVVGVEWNLSKTKYLIPRIKFQDVQLSGTNVSYCAGMNAQYIKENGIGPGAQIEVLKSGEIIPYLEKVHESVDVTKQIPTHCPCCNAELVWNGVHLQCPNRQCADSDIQDVLVWMENIAPYDQLGDTLKLKFLGQMFGETISVDAIYEHGQEQYIGTRLARYNDFQKMYNQLFTNKVKLADAIRALNIPRFGEVTSRKLAQYPQQVMALIYAAHHPRVPLHSDGFEDKIGEANYKSLVDNLWKFKRLTYIRENIDWSGEPNIDEMPYIKVAITGKLSVKRSVFEQELKDAGFVTGSISKDCAFLITDDPNSSSEKNKKAEKWGIIKITEKDFRSQYLNR